MKYKTRFRAFFFAMMLFHLAANFAHPVTPTVIQELKLHDYMFGLALAVMMIANFLFSPFWGKINAYISSRQSLFIGCMGYGIAQLFFCYATTEAGILGARLLAGVFVGAIFVSFLTYVVNTARPEDQAKYLTYSATINAVFAAFGYLIGGVIGEYSVKGAFLVQSAMLIGVGILFRLICLPDAGAERAPAFRTLLKSANPLKAFADAGKFMTTGFFLLFCVNVLMNFGNTGFDQAFNYYLKDQLGLTSSYNGMIKAAVGLVSFVFNMSLCLWIIRKTDNARSLVLLTGVCTVAAVGTILPAGVGIFITMGILVYAGYSVSIPVLQNMVAQRSRPEEKNLVMGFYNATKSLGSICGSLTAGFIYGVDVRLPFLCVGIIYGLSVLSALLYRRHTIR